MSSRAEIEARIETPHLTIEGRSRAGNETFFRVRELGIALDIGRCPDLLVGIDHVFVTHAHLDHAVGIPRYAAQRRLHRFDAGHVYVPAEAVDDYRELMSIHERLEGTKYPLEWIGMAPGTELAFKRDLIVRAHRSPHRVAAVGYEFLQRRLKMDETLLAFAPQEIARLRREEPQHFHEEHRSLLFYTGDTDAAIFDVSPAVFDSEVLVIECSFTRDTDHDRAVEYRHLHIDDIFAHADRFACDTIVLTHFSMRDSAEAVHRLISKRAPERLRPRLRLALPEQYSRLTEL